MLDPSTLLNSGDHGRVPLRPATLRGLDAKLRQSDEQLRSLAAIIELVTALDRQVEWKDAGREAAHLTRDLVSASRVIVLWREKSSPSLQVIGDTETAKDFGDQHKFIVAAGEEAALKGGVFRWGGDRSNESGLSEENRSGLLAVAQFAKVIGARSIDGVPLRSHRDETPGVILVIDYDREKNTPGFLEVMSEPIAAKLAGIELLRLNPLEAKLRSLSHLGSKTRRSWLCIAGMLLLGILLLPLSYRIQADIEVQPVLRRYVAVPFDGPLKTASVRPGDVVRQGELLAEIDAREIEYELSGIRAELRRSLQEKKGLMADHDVAASQIAGLESERLQLHSDLLRFRLENLEIRSPISGVVVHGDWKQSEGMPMSRGETLFEIAPLDEMVVEVAIPEADIHHVREGMETVFFVNAMPNQMLRGKLLRIHPNAELRAHENVYIAELQLHNPGGIYRPGMRGQARILSDRHTLAWNLFHKPWYSLRRVVGW